MLGGAFQAPAATADVTTVFQLSQEHVSGGGTAFGLAPAFYQPKQPHGSVGRQHPLQQHGRGHQNAYTPSPPLPFDSVESHYSTLQLERMEDEYHCCGAALDAPVAAPELPARNGTGGQRGALARLGHH